MCLSLIERYRFRKGKIRIKEELASLDENLIRIERKLANEDFISKAQHTAIEKKKAEKEEFLKKREKLMGILKTIGGKMKDKESYLKELKIRLIIFLC